MLSRKMNVGVFIPTLNAGRSWRDCLGALARQTLKADRLLIIDSGSTDETVGIAASAGFEVRSIPKSEFDHGGTRQLAVEHLSSCDVIVFLTQDAILADETSLELLVDCFLDPLVAVAYGRQLPHVGASPIEAHARIFNYPSLSVKKSLSSVGDLGSRVFFCSNSYAAYKREVLQSLGGFRSMLILGEDMEYAARAVKAGYINFYCADSCVRHSHDYSLAQTLSRYFDIGAFDAEIPWMRKEFGSHRGEGMRFVWTELKYLAGVAPTQIPYAILQTVSKLLGYRLGRGKAHLPVSLRKKISMHPNYWTNSS